MVDDRAESARIQAASAQAGKAQENLLIFLLDTCVLSEATKPRQHGGVLTWLSEHPLEAQYVSAVSIGELHFGVERLSHGRKQRDLRKWVGDVEMDYAGRVVPFDQAIAACWGRLRSQLPNLPLIDGQIAATALTYSFSLVTRNIRDFAAMGLDIVNPWHDGAK